jgi:two-component system, LytTR family, response regulator
MTLRILIADDEELARERLREALSGREDVELVGVCDGGHPALEAIRRERPDLILLDVQMPEVDGFEVLRRLQPDETPAVIFVTAYEEHALRAFDVHAMDYLLKPFRDERLHDAVDRAVAALRGGHGNALVRSVRALIESIDGEARPPSRIAIRTSGRVVFLATSEIDWFEAAGNYILVHAGDKTHLLRETMSELERRLDTKHFARAHRSAIVNLERVREVRVSGSGDGRVVLGNRREVPLSRRYRRAFEEALGV